MQLCAVEAGDPLLHAQVVGFLQQHLEKPDAQTFLGSGKLAELLELIQRMRARAPPAQLLLLLLLLLARPLPKEQQPCMRPGPCCAAACCASMLPPVLPTLLWPSSRERQACT
jgi:hypothetical protein